MLGSSPSRPHEKSALTRILDQARESAATAAGLTTMGAILWIGLSDRVVSAFARSREELETMQTWKGMFFVLIMGIGLYITLRVLLARDAKRALVQLQAERALVALEHQRNAEMVAAAIAHDVRNNLSVIRMVGAELAEAGRLDPDQHEALGDLQQAVDHASALMGRLKDAWRREEPDPVEADVAALAERVTQLVQRHPAVRRCALQVHLAPDLPVLVGYPRLVEQALLNLILNAAQAAGSAAVVEVCAARQGEDVLLSVDDNGPGVPPALAQRIFEPLFTTRAEGTGLGLLSVQLAARVHQGEVALQRSPLGGARFTLLLRRGVAGESSAGGANT